MSNPNSSPDERPTAERPAPAASDPPNPPPPGSEWIRVALNRLCEEDPGATQLDPILYRMQLASLPAEEW